MNNAQRIAKRAMVGKYRDKMRRWTMEVLPTMPEDQWNLFVQWVEDFGADMSRPHRKVKRRLTEAREVKTVQILHDLLAGPEIRQIIQDYKGSEERIVVQAGLGARMLITGSGKARYVKELSARRMIQKQVDQIQKQHQRIEALALAYGKCPGLTEPK